MNAMSVSANVGAAAIACDLPSCSPCQSRRTCTEGPCRRSRRRPRVEPGGGSADACFTANTGRAHFDYRACVVAHKYRELQKRLTQAGRVTIRDWRTATHQPWRSCSPVIRRNMPAWSARSTRPRWRFARRRDRCAELPSTPAKAAAGRPRRYGQRVATTRRHTQPVLFRCRIRVCRTVESGITPKIVMDTRRRIRGVCRAGVLCRGCFRLIAARGRLMYIHCRQAGGMTAIAASEARVLSALAPFGTVSPSVP